MTSPTLNALARAALAALAAAAAPTAALATNGMLLEGYGPVATGMGGASSATDNGIAAATNNPATLALGDGRTRLDLAIGQLGPRVSSSAGPMKAQSSGTSYIMPAFGWGSRTGALSYGVAVFAQGGMGTEYGADSFLAMGSGDRVRSELGVGRVLVPLAFQVTPSLAVGGSIDFVWSSLDMKFAASGAQLGAMVTGAGGNLAMALPALGGAPWARIDFSDDNDFSGAATATGWAFKLGLVWSASDTLRLGISHHAKTALKDMQTAERDATLSAPGGFADGGRLTVVDFQMPAQTTVGLAWQATPTTLVAMDVKRIGWSDVMDSFRMRYDSAGMGGFVSFAMPQRWKDQTVLQLGLAQQIGAWTLRAGINRADNPIPDAFVNPLFPAIVKNHLALGVGVNLGSAEVNASYVHAPEVSVNTPSGVVVSHRQRNLQLMYSQRF